MLFKHIDATGSGSQRRVYVGQILLYKSCTNEVEYHMYLWEGVLNYLMDSDNSDGKDIFDIIYLIVPALYIAEEQIGEMVFNPVR